MNRKDFPSIKSLASDLKANADWWDSDTPEIEYLEVRLQVVPGEGWALHTGDASFDRDHRGYLGAGSVEPGASMAECRRVARDLIDQAREMEPC